MRSQGLPAGAKIALTERNPKAQETRNKADESRRKQKRTTDMVLERSIERSRTKHIMWFQNFARTQLQDGTRILATARHLCGSALSQSFQLVVR